MFFLLFFEFFFEKEHFTVLLKIQVSNPTIINMRRQLKENQAVMVSKDKEIDNLKKAPKMTRISELEVKFLYKMNEVLVY